MEDKYNELNKQLITMTKDMPAVGLNQCSPTCVISDILYWLL